MNIKLGNIFKGDKVIWMVFFFLCIVSVIEVFSASSTLTYKGGSYWGPVIKHTAILLLGVMAMIFVVNVPCRFFKIVTIPLLFLSAFFLVWAGIAGQATNDASRWVTFLGIPFQPSEIAKGTLVLTVAQVLSAMQTENGADKQAMKYIMGITSLFVIVIFLENFSTAALLCLVFLMMMIVGRVPAQQIGKLMGGATIVVVSFLLLVLVIGKEVPKEDGKQQLTEQVAEKEKPSTITKIFHRFDTWKARIIKFVHHEEVPPEEFDLDKDSQIGHSNIAIASSNIIGKGPGNSVERDFLPQAFSDFIYAIIIEEMGLIGGAFVAALYIILLFRVGRIAHRCENNFPAFLIMGLALLLVTQALFNMLVAVGLAPVTGQPLPLISKGGTSSVINCIYIGVILSVSRTAKKRKEADGKQMPEMAMVN
ncbi:MAG: FtsW/RodA/SpoVE family cell cycle protein [Prevotella sp.]|nr:FtsW/RodA/SpoVE family cell cycle protein [Prevotella sp.]